MIKSSFYRFIGNLILLLFTIGLLVLIFIFIKMILSNDENLLVAILYFIIYMVLTPATGLLFLSHADVLDKLNTIKIAEQHKSELPVKIKPKDWTCSCGANNKGYIDICLTCGKEKTKE